MSSSVSTSTFNIVTNIRFPSYIRISDVSLKVSCNDVPGSQHFDSWIIKHIRKHYKTAKPIKQLCNLATNDYERRIIHFLPNISSYKLTVVLSSKRMVAKNTPEACIMQLESCNKQKCKVKKVLLDDGIHYFVFPDNTEIADFKPFNDILTADNPFFCECFRARVKKILRCVDATGDALSYNKTYNIKMELEVHKLTITGDQKLLLLYHELDWHIETFSSTGAEHLNEASQVSLATTPIWFWIEI